MYEKRKCILLLTLFVVMVYLIIDSTGTNWCSALGHKAKSTSKAKRRCTMRGPPTSFNKMNKYGNIGKLDGGNGLGDSGYI